MLKYRIMTSRIILLLLFCTCNLFLHSQIVSKTDAIVERDFIFDEAAVPFNNCHASTIIDLDNENYMIAWFGGTGEGYDDVGIWMLQGKSGKWQPPKQVAKIRNDAHWNPVLFKEDNGTIHLYFKVAKEIRYWETWEIISKDNGNTWSEPRELVKGDKGGRGPVRAKMIVLSDGTWLAGASFEENTGKMHWDVFVDRSEDKGKTWEATPYLELDRNNFLGKGVIQPSLWESQPGNVHMLVRSTNGYIYRSDSKDYGKTWCPLYPIDMPNNNSGIDLIKLKGDTLILVYNPVSGDGGSRALLNIAISYNNGISWTDKLALEAGAKGEEYSYPSIINKGDIVAITYTSNRKNIAFWEIDTKKLIEK